MKSTHLKILLLAFYCINNLFSSAYAATKPEIEPNQWHYIVAPYGWLSATSANITVKNVNDHIFIPVSQVLKELNFVGEIHLEANKGRLTFMLDPTYVKLSKANTLGPLYIGPLKQTVPGPINANITSQTLLIDGGVFYEAFKNQQSPTESVSLQLLAGGRYLGLKNQLALDFSRTQFFPKINVSASTNVVAPIIGARVFKDFSKIHLWLKGDVGGFNVDHISSTWGASVGLTYKVREHFDLGLAYRVLKINVKESTNLGFNILMYGPELGVVFKY